MGRDLDQGRDLGQSRGTGGSSISPSAAAPSTQDFKWLGAGPAPSQPHPPHAQTSVSLAESPTEALTRRIKRRNRLPQLFLKKTSSQNL